MNKVDWFSCESPGKEDNIREFSLLERCVQEAIERNPGTLLIEIGSYCGLTANLMAQYAPVMCVDVWAQDSLNPADQLKVEGVGQSESWRKFNETRERFGFVDRIFPVCATSAYLDILPPLNVELAFVDACHDMPWPLIDAQKCDRHLTKTGILVFHDAMRGYVKEYERSVKSVKECIGHGWGYPPMDRMMFDPWQGVATAIEKLLDTGKWRVYDKAHGMMALERK